MFTAGANGYLHKSSSLEIILNVIRRVARGGTWIPQDLADRIVFAMNGVTGTMRLSGREYQVLQLFASGMRMTDIATQLSLSVKTISTYRTRLMEKLNLSSNAQLIRYAFKQGITD
jgi:two-component system, NarL family, invasion response regulator UvrY